MSEQLGAAAAALDLPESLVKRSAEARATETGATVDEILAAWAGGAPAPAATTPTAETEPSEVPAEVEEESAEAAPPPAPVTPATPPPSSGLPPEPPPPSGGPFKPPVLIGAADNPLKVFAGVVGLFLVVLLVGLIGPSVQTANPGGRTSEISFSPMAEQGRSRYASLGCSSCHTQMVRPVIADVGLGAVTLNNTNQVLGSRRFGPDLSNVGARLNPTELSSVIAGAGGHPAHNLRAEQLETLVAYLSESVTMRGGG